MTEKNCANCVYIWKPPTGETVCRFFPPTALVQPMMVRTVDPNNPGVDWSRQASSFPLVRDDFWCGQHQLAPPKLAICQ